MLSGAYYEYFGEKEFFQQHPKLYKKMKAILQTVLESREENEPYLYRTTWISDAYALGKYHTGTNLCMYRSFMALARIAEEVFGEKSYAEMLRSEAGKTRITNLLTRFYEIWDGGITLDGRDIRTLNMEELRKNIALVLQDTHLFTGTVMENIRYGRLDASDEEVIAAAKTANADYFIRHLSEGYDTVLEGDGSNLSQGQRQLLNIARAALSKAPVLIMDEATSSVDTITERQIQDGMDRLMSDRTTFVIAHRLSTIRNADAIMVLENGEIIEWGTHDQLLAMKGRYYELYTGKAELD